MMVLSGFIGVNGFLFKLTVDGRFRRHWKGEIRSRDSRSLSAVKLAICPQCGVLEKLTVDHCPPLREVSHNNNRVLICKTCHHKKNILEAPTVDAIAPKFVNNCGFGHNTFLLDNLDIYCRVCSRVVNSLVCVGVNEFVTVDRVK